MSVAPSNESRLLCRVCEKQCSKYACPRCNVRYCSLECYKVHGERCTEGFYRENLAGELQGLRASEEDKQKMLLTLQRLHMDEEAQPLGEEEEDEEEELSEAMVDKLAIGAELSLQDLSPEEQEGFRQSLKSGDLGAMIGAWQPWWTLPDIRQLSLGTTGTSLVRDLSSEEDEGPAVESADIPAPPTAPIPSLRSLTSTPPSPRLPYHLADLVYALCFTCRMYNGEWEWDAAGAAGALLSISGVLGQEGTPHSLEEAVGGCLERAGRVEWKDRGGSAYRVALIADVAALLEGGRTAVVLSLEEMRRMVEAGMRDSGEVRGKGKGEGKGSGRNTKSKRKMQLLVRKLLYFSAWANEEVPCVWDKLSADVKACFDLQWDIVGKREKGTLLDTVLLNDKQGESKPLIQALD